MKLTAVLAAFSLALSGALLAGCGEPAGDRAGPGGTAQPGGATTPPPPERKTTPGGGGAGPKQ
jgi:hypothetical protein